jgi:hypothetical protein
MEDHFYHLTPLSSLFRVTRGTIDDYGLYCQSESAVISDAHYPAGALGALVCLDERGTPSCPAK